MTLNLLNNEPLVSKPAEFGQNQTIGVVCSSTHPQKNFFLG